MSLTELLGALEEDAAADLARTQRESAAEAERVLDAARRAAAERHEREVAAAEQVAAAEAGRTLAAARREAAQVLRAVREEELAAVLGAARERLSGPERPAGAPAALSAALGEALGAVPDARRLHVDPRDAERLQAVLAQQGRTDLAVVPDLRTDGGLVAVGARRSVDDTTATRLTAAWPGLRGELSRRWETEGA